MNYFIRIPIIILTLALAYSYLDAKQTQSSTATSQPAAAPSNTAATEQSIELSAKITAKLDELKNLLVEQFLPARKQLIADRRAILEKFLESTKDARQQRKTLRDNLKTLMTELRGINMSEFKKLQKQHIEIIKQFRQELSTTRAQERETFIQDQLAEKEVSDAAVE